VSVAIDQPDGTKLSINDVALTGKLAIISKPKKFDIEIDHLGLNVLLEKPGGALKLGVSKLATGLSVHLDGGKGTVGLHPLGASILVAREGLPDKTFDCRARRLDVRHRRRQDRCRSRSPPRWRARGRFHRDQRLAGERQARRLAEGRCARRSLDAGKVNELLGKEILATDVDVEAHVSGAPDKIAIDAKVTTQGGERHARRHRRCR